jgi:hypothetical protein
MRLNKDKYIDTDGCADSFRNKTLDVVRGVFKPRPSRGVVGAWIRHVHGNGETGFYRPTDLLVKPYTNLAVTVPNHPFFEKTGIFE